MVVYSIFDQTGQFEQAVVAFQSTPPFQALETLKKQYKEKAAKKEIEVVPAVSEPLRWTQQKINLIAGTCEDAAFQKEEIKALKRAMDLPVTKPILYRKEIEYGVWKTYLVESMWVWRQFDEWNVLELTLDGGGSVRIHHAYLSQMQKPDFLDTIRNGGTEEE